MLEEDGEVVELEGNQAWILTIRQSACDSCKLKSGCGQSVLSKLTDGKSHRVLVKNSLDAVIGDVVTLQIPEDGLIKASFLVYCLPLISLLLFALFAQSVLALGDLGVSISGVLGLAVGFLTVRLISSKMQFDDRYNPKMVRKRTLSNSI